MFEIEIVGLEEEEKIKLSKSIMSSGIFQDKLEKIESTLEMLEEFLVEELSRKLTLEIKKSRMGTMSLHICETRFEIHKRAFKESEDHLLTEELNSALERISNQLAFLLKLERSKEAKKILNLIYNFN